MRLLTSALSPSFGARSPLLRSVATAAARAAAVHPPVTADATVPLRYELHTPPPTADGTGVSAPSPLVVLHGLFGSKQNWRSLARGFAQRLGAPVYALDLRNHGESPHEEHMDGAIMAADVARFLREHALERATLLGHSMGARVAMTLALDGQQAQERDRIQRLVLVDMSAREIPVSETFGGYVRGMKAVEAAGFSRQADADAMLATYAPELAVRQFLLTNLKRDTANGQYRFRVPLDTIERALPEIGRFRPPINTRPFLQPTLLVAGARSGYVKPGDHAVLRELFPAIQFASLDTGHWVHAEKPAEFTRLVVDFSR
ncbi:mitochondrial hydrolase [Thamnocephalis sphaerospora]|uniref:Mitochondrial hydrolase n=1 Tax=Thamnocephalis sphaerospora TaxID=78915 RepID=A0A4P9XKB6_9FUNG|nr:mitochondrial hydrolase [Thamnocephalis sphaerospora]|eukprot:RKP06196.1 mitochondrial hydrolase [Thamnocephalis sphaerospora]